MMFQGREALQDAARDEEIDAVVVTGTGKYYCAGVDLAAVLKPQAPKKLLADIESLNKQLFDQYISFPKPIFVAVNGPAIGAAATSATLMDGIFANQRASFVTPFDAVGLVPEGCSSYLFPKIFGDELASKLLNENLKISAQEALDAGMVKQVVETSPSEGADEELLAAAQSYAENYVSKHGRVRSVSPEETAKRQQVNAEESKALAEAFLSVKFLKAVEGNAARKGRTSTKLTFQALRLTRPIWSKLV